jgi:hypothetical protein
MKMNLSNAAFVVALLVIGAAPAAAQFETPNRSFHNTSAFRLEGRHQTVPCASCHLNGQYRGTPTTCYACHWVRRRDDRFQTRLGSQCEQCHRPISWSAVNWNHAAQAGVPLNAGHRTLTCESCHRNGDVRAIAVTCVSCHQRDFDTTTAPNHRAAGFPVSCESCHRPGDTTWQRSGGGGFSHATVFPLVGVHATAACQACHRNNVYRGTPRECVACHLTQYNATQNPNHVAANFPTTCEVCHRPADPTWRSGATFDHNTVFTLVGVHATQTCQACHRNNVYRGTPRECVGCHQAQYTGSQNPNHAAANFPTTCETCHRPTDPSWRSGSGFNHNSVFALVGVHASQSCQACHKNNVYRGTPRDCIGCHQPDYNAAQNPSHVAANFPTSCDTCHRPTDPQWRGATFNHNAVFPLVGVHASQTCQACHRNNVYRGTPRNCIGCHLTAYNSTTNPNHAAAGFPTSCESCHRPTDPSWNRGQFNHTWFPLTGPHNRPCAQCHTTQNNFAQFSCTVCHARSETDSHHRQIAGYRYDSAACYSCHPNGRH